MNILISGLWFPLGTDVVLRDAFRRMGHRVYTVGACFGDVIPWGGMMTLPGKAQLPDVEMTWDARLTVSEIEERIADKIEFVLQCDPNFYIERGESAAPNVCYASDNHVLQYPHIDDYDIFFAAHSFAHHKEHPKFRWLPGAREPHAYDMHLERRYDVCMIGTMYQQRYDVVKVLLSKNVNMLLGCGRLFEEWNYLHNLALATVVEPCNADLSGRVFNHMAQGTLVIMRRGLVDAEKIGMRESMHYLSYEHLEELPERIRIARDPHARKVLTERAKVWVEPHTWESRLETMLREVFG